MLKHPTRRWLAGIGLAGALVAAAATPASATETEITLGVYFDNVTLAAGSAGKDRSSTISASAPVTLHDLTVQYDFSDLAGKVDVSSESLGNDCTTPEPHVLRCVQPFAQHIEDSRGAYSLSLVPTAAGANGDEGVLKVSFSAQGFSPVTHEATVRIGTGVDLVAGAEHEFSVAPGETFTEPLTVSNAGEVTADGAVAYFDHDYAIRADQRYSNCNYDGDHLVFCRFDEKLTPGASYSASLTHTLGADTYAPSFIHGNAYWQTPAEFEAYEARLHHLGISLGEPGTGGKLTLTEQNRIQSAREAQADTDPSNNWSHMDITAAGSNGTDLAAIGAEVSGEKDAEILASIGFRNNGPATLDYSRPHSSVTYLEVDIPQGTTATGVPDNCAPLRGNDLGEWGEPGGEKYHCYAAIMSKVDEQETFDFTLRIDEVIADASAAVKVNVPCQCDGGFYDDIKPANDEAAILVNATGDTGGGGGGADPSLPITGDSTLRVAGLGGLLLAIGAAGFLVARRRRNSFVA
ncbi:LPXTG cell wall anchor domain-containing protein [Salinispora sp. H7-4]|uniref:LPXTG cell wall anchor domain-containing protein n=1 Tax=Salinispora sp. H7-4 TaxID=2748321 RepID=UPI0015D30D6B|nr:LPXTG cell wall anchor domain-containing protein [Salinispora sp. H7-4]NYT95387.1 LPXTG cell wall anchor domain-containing protein [Salinispora sp. H7-4]